MAFTPEDGTGVVGANSYVTEAFSLTYHADRGNTAWAALATSALREQALVRATDYIDKRFGRRFIGWRQSSDQGLEWPRIDAFDADEFLINGVPTQIQKAISEYALRAATTNPLAPDNSDVGLEGLREKIGPIEVERKIRMGLFSASGSSMVDPTSIPDYPEADLWIEELLKSNQSRDLARA